MCQNPPAHAAQSAETNWSRLLPGLQLIHTIYLVSGANLAVVARAATYLDGERAPVRSWTVVRRNGMLEHKIILNDMGEHRAAELLKQLLTVEDVLRARVEHCFFRQGLTDEPALAHPGDVAKALSSLNP